MQVCIFASPAPRPAAITCLAIVLALSACGSTPQNSAAPRDLSSARATVEKAAAMPGLNSFQRDLGRARAVFVVSPRSGGVAMARSPGSRDWSGPAFYGLARVNAGRGGVTGFSRLPQESELVAAFISERSLDWLRSPALPGRSGLRLATAAAGDDERAQADVVVLDLQRAQASKLEYDFTLITIDAAANRAWYGQALTPADILARADGQTGESGALQRSIAILAGERKP